MPPSGGEKTLFSLDARTRLPLTPTLVRFAAQALKGRRRLFRLGRSTRLSLISIATLCVLAAGPVEAGHRLYDMGVFLTASDRPRTSSASAGRTAAEGAREGLGGILSEVRLGVLKHDFGPFSSSEEHGIDVNLEFLFVAPDALEFLGSPRPHLGVTINTDDDTNQAYFGLSWEFDVWRDWFVGFSETPRSEALD